MNYRIRLVILSAILVFASNIIAKAEVYDCGYGSICDVLKLGNYLYITSTDENKVIEYNTVNQQIERTWDTGDKYPMFIKKRPGYDELAVLLHLDIGETLTRTIGLIDLNSGIYNETSLIPMPILNFDYDESGDNIYLCLGEQLIAKGELVKIDCVTWLEYDRIGTNDYPLGIGCLSSDAIFTSSLDTIPTYYSYDGMESPGPPYMSQVNKYTDVSRLTLEDEIIMPEGLNYLEKMDQTRVVTMHIPMNEGSPQLCIIDSEGIITDTVYNPEIKGVLDAAYCASTDKLYATVVVDGVYDPEVDVPKLEYCGHLLVYDLNEQTAVLFEDYFDHNVSLINLCDNKLVINSMDSSIVYVIEPF